MEEFRACPACGYTRGFHVSFRKSENGFAVWFICPECGSSFDLGLMENRLTALSPGKGDVYPL